MLLRRFGAAFHSVTPSFDSRALSEISFRRNGAHAIPVEEFEQSYRKVSEEAIGGEAEGSVQSTVEDALLRRLEADVADRLARLSEGEVLVVENEQGVDYPKARDKKRGTIVEGENRLHFEWRIDPALRLGHYRRIGS
jgi:hypothetical protein